MLCPQKAYQDYAKKHTMAAGTADSSKLELAMMRPWKRRSHLRDGNADRINSALCRSKSSSSGLSFLHHRQSSEEPETSFEWPCGCFVGLENYEVK